LRVVSQGDLEPGEIGALALEVADQTGVASLLSRFQEARGRFRVVVEPGLRIVQGGPYPGTVDVDFAKGAARAAAGLLKNGDADVLRRTFQEPGSVLEVKADVVLRIERPAIALEDFPDGGCVAAGLMGLIEESVHS
jgi:hypothetical protein